VLKTGILDSHFNPLLSRVRHTKTFVIADVGFSFWPGVEIVNLRLWMASRLFCKFSRPSARTSPLAKPLSRESFLEQCGGNPIRTCERPRTGGHPDHARTPPRV
jgi:hypothetical protein